MDYQIRFVDKTLMPDNLTFLTRRMDHVSTASKQIQNGCRSKLLKNSLVVEAMILRPVFSCISVSGCMLQTQVRKLSSKEHSKKAPHS